MHADGTGGAEPATAIGKPHSAGEIITVYINKL